MISQHPAPCKNQTAAVAVSDIVFRGLRGTFHGGSTAGQFNCADSTPCTGLVLDDIALASDTGSPAAFRCWQAHGRAVAPVSPASCLVQSAARDE